MTPPPPRLRNRLTLLHAGIAFVYSAGLLTIIEFPLVTASHTAPAPEDGRPTTAVTVTNLPRVLEFSAVLLLVIAVVSFVFGWLVAGRELKPLRDITAAARAMSAEDLTRRLHVKADYREFTELADTLDGMRQRLQESFEAQRLFVANASHELRTPLTVQRTLLELALADPDAPADTLRKACHELLALGKQQEDLITALLTLASSYQPIDDGERIDLADVIRNAVQEHRDQAEADRITVDVDLAPATVTGDPHLIASLVANLLGNAVRHNHPGGTVEIATTPSGSLEVSNSGAPLDPADIARMFQPFQRLGTDRTDHTTGHGLGLAIVAAIAQAHRATLTAHPRPGGGLHVTVDFLARPPATPT